MLILQTLKKGVEKQRSVVESLREKSEALTKANPESELADQVNQMLRQYDSIAENVEVFITASNS